VRKDGGEEESEGQVNKSILFYSSSSFFFLFLFLSVKIVSNALRPIALGF
jgi:hypothetical protein